jgi:hypothetical protein
MQPIAVQESRMPPMSHTEELEPETAEAAPQVLADETLSLTGRQGYIVCAFYTPNYLEQVLSLKASLDALGLSYFLKRYDRAASWEATTRIKPVFVDHCMSRFPQFDVLYLDADAVVRKEPTFFDTVTTDVCLFMNPVKPAKTHFIRIAAGTLLVRNTEGGRRFARAWKAEEANASMLSLDEDLIYMALPKLEGVSFTALPQIYTKIFDKPGAEPVIEHFQASRTQFKWRRVIRRARRLVVALGIVAALLLAYWLSKHLVWKP